MILAYIGYAKGDVISKWSYVYQYEVIRVFALGNVILGLALGRIIVRLGCLSSALTD